MPRRPPTLAAIGAGCIVALVLGGCGSSGPAGLGRKACPYIRPRLVRIDRDRTQPAGGTEATADLVSVSEDFAIYVRQLPAGGHTRADRELVTFAAALRASTTSPDVGGASAARLETAESALKHRCGVA
ncbi:MAG: hypothetical protein NVSMB16_08190 [Acidimicrobiales bacterium]